MWVSRHHGPVGTGLMMLQGFLRETCTHTTKCLEGNCRILVKQKVWVNSKGFGSSVPHLWPPGYLEICIYVHLYRWISI